MTDRGQRKGIQPKWSTTAAVLLLLTGTVFSARAYGQDAAKEIDDLLTRYHDYGQFNGSVLVAKGGNVVYKKGFGLADMEWNIPNAPDTKFRLGSITKQFTSMLIMQRVEQGQLRLEGHLSDYLPYYLKETGDKITLRHLLSHTSGIPNYTELPHFFREVSRNPYEVKEFVQKYCSRDLEFEPGSKFSYSNSGYFILGAILEQLTGKSYETLLHERILEPLGMKDTGYDHWDTILPHRAVGYEKSLKGFHRAAYLDMSIPYSAGSLYSTVEDLHRWDQALYTEKLVSAKSREIMFTPFLGDYAFGWVVKKQLVGPNAGPRVVIGHEGGINGFNTLITRIPEDRNLVVFLNNTGGAPLEEAARGVINILYGRPAEPPKRSIAEVMLKTLDQKGVDAAITQYRELKKTAPSGYNFDERQLNELGYHLIQQNKTKEALAILQLNAEVFPNSSNVYDSLGEAYMQDGQVEEAIRNYAKSLALNPQNSNAIEKLSKLQEKRKESVVHPKG